MKKITCALFLLLNVGGANAELQLIGNDELDVEAGQAGIALSLEMRLNADSAGNSLCGRPSLPIVECRMAIGINNRGKPNIDQEWLVFKGVYGRIYVPYLSVDADTVTYTDDNGASQTIAAGRLGYGGAANKVRIDHLTISNIAMEYDTAIVKGYNVADEDGFLGLEINGQVEMSGTLKVFPCTSNHPRC